MNRFFTRTEAIAEYRLPTHVADELASAVIPVEKNDKGEPLYLEAHLDVWLSARYADCPQHGNKAEDKFLTIREVAALLKCSYSEARERMLDGRIRTIKDGRWLRTRREWVEAYVATKTIKPLPEDRIPIKAIRGRRKVDTGITLKKGGMGHKFLTERQKRQSVDSDKAK